MKKYIELARVKHWLKNFLIFLPLFFSSNLFVFDKIILAFLGFIVFSFVSSVVYIFNDINDIENDRAHEIKKNRPLPSGRISVKHAWFFLIILLFVSLAFSILLFKVNGNLFVIIIPLVYLFLNVLYSKWFKKKPIIDVVILVSGFLFRVIYGGLITYIEVSKWLYLMIIFGSFYLGFGKRRNEIVKNGIKSRDVLKYYNKDFLDKNMYVCLSLAIVSYSLWCVDPSNIARCSGDYLFWTIPYIMIIFQLYSLNIEKNSYGDPIEVLLSDKILLLLVFCYVLLMMLLLYVI